MWRGRAYACGCRCQKRALWSPEEALDFLELELQVVMNDGPRPWEPNSNLQEQHILLSAEPSLQPYIGLVFVLLRFEEFHTVAEDIHYVVRNSLCSLDWSPTHGNPPASIPK